MATNRLPEHTIDIIDEDRRMYEAGEEVRALLKLYLPKLQEAGNRAADPAVQELGLKIAQAVEREAEAFVEILRKLTDAMEDAREFHGFDNAGIDQAIKLHAYVRGARRSMAMIFSHRSGRNPEAN